MYLFYGAINKRILGVIFLIDFIIFSLYVLCINIIIAVKTEDVTPTTFKGKNNNCKNNKMTYFYYSFLVATFFFIF